MEINLFKLEDIYQVHQDIVGELVVKAEEFKAKQENIRQFYSALATNDSELYQFYFGNYLNPNDHNKRPLAKLTRDIVLEIVPESSFSI
jgi:succinate dehydrogenase flavin-adding protein (antitoxin of CptAB toxin-antitoxin module)